MNQSSISFWALPSRQTKEYYQNKINSLSERYKSNVFIPHITIYVGKSTFEESRVILSAFINKQQLTLIPLAVEASAELAKTFYISFKLNLELQSFCEYINDNMSSPSKYVFSPHMSLLYKKFKDNEYFSLLNREVVDLRELKIDEICVVSTPSSFNSIEDITKWKILDRVKLSY